LNSSQKNKRIVFVSSRFPYPLEKGDKLRAYHQIRILSDYFDIHLVSLYEKKITTEQREALAPFCKSIQTYYLPMWYKWFSAGIQFFTSQPFQVGYFYNPFVKRKVKKHLKELNPDHIYCQLIRASEYVKDYHRCTKTIDYMDALSKGIERRIEKSSWIKRYLFQQEFNRLLVYENSIFEYFENHTIITEEDRNQIFHKKLDKIQVVKNGVDELFFEKLEAEKKYDLVFTGNMSYPPNIKAACYLVKEILPLCKKEYKVCISGANPVSDILALQNKNIEVTGWVDDIRSSYASSKVFIAPMTIGTGLQNKLLEAMAMKLPCVTTPLANKALGATHSENILIGESPKELAECIDLILDDQELQTKISASGREFVHNNYDWLNVTKPLIDLLNR
jgi:glycosyltransferase involved in cell wall biosynthesis